MLIYDAHGRPLNDVTEDCKHTCVMPEFNEIEARRLSTAEVRKRWPRFMGICPTCGEQVILYASMGHYIHGDW